MKPPADFEPWGDHEKEAKDMGYGKDKATERRGAKGTPTARAGSVFGARDDGRGGGVLADVPGLAPILDNLTSAGAAIIIARTSDGGAYAFTLMDGDLRERAWAHTQDELDQIFVKLAHAYPAPGVGA